MIVDKSKSDPIKTCLVITAGFLVVYLVGKLKYEASWDWALYTAAIIAIAGVFSSYLAKKIDWLWMKLTLVLSLIVPNIVLSIVFYIFLTPIAWLSRIFGSKNPLTLKNTESTMFKSHVKDFSKESFKKTW